MIPRLAIGAALAVAVALTVTVTGCGGAASPAVVELDVAAASSLLEAVAALTGAYAREHRGVTFTLATGSSAALRAQIEQGAPIDVFLSADEVNPGALADAGLADGPPVPFATNTLALIVPTGNPAGIASPMDLARPGVRVVAAADTVPIAAYAAEVVEGLAATSADPAAFRAALDANVVSREENVAAVLARVELGEGDAAFVYRTDAVGNTRVASIPIPDEANVRAEYAGVVIGESSNAGAGREFLAWVAGPAGRAVLAASGFGAP